MKDPTQRFSDKVADYIKYRPGYPGSIIDFLKENTGLSTNWKIADIGSGTGISTELFLKAGCEVFAVEPNLAMREAAENLLGKYDHFKSINGTAEATTLPGKSVEMIVAGQAFHWFDQKRTRTEFERILQPGGWVVLLWNDRIVEGDFLAAYEALIHRFATDYDQVNHKNIDIETIGKFFKPANVNLKTFPNQQVFDFDGLKGRLLSSSYIIPKTHPDFPKMLEELKALFDQYKQEGTVVVKYETLVYYGQLT